MIVHSLESRARMPWGFEGSWRFQSEMKRREHACRSRRTADPVSMRWRVLALAVLGLTPCAQAEELFHGEQPRKP